MTLIETMDTVTLLAILLTLGVPGMMGFVLDARRDSQMSDLIATLVARRSREAHRSRCVRMQ